MSGLLRRIKRSRTADAGVPPAPEQAAAPEGAPTPAGGGEATVVPAATAPAIHADPAKPAGLDPIESAPRPAGRRGRLRRRLRYLRRARELMLRDLGGLVFEVHRSGGGDYGAHSNVIGGKVERLATLDAEASAIEEVLGARRPESVVFQPGVGGTCDVCGELYGSAARFCWSCGSAIDPAARATPAAATAAPSEPRVVPPMPKPAAGASEQRPTRELATGATAAGEPAAAGAAEEPATDAPTAPAGPASPDAPAGPASPDPSAGPASPDPSAGPASPDAPAGPASPDPSAGPASPDPSAGPTSPDPPAGPTSPDAPTSADQPTVADAPTSGGEPTASAPAEPDRRAEPGRNPFSGISNGRPEDKHEPPELSSGDPLAARESRQ